MLSRPASMARCLIRPTLSSSNHIIKQSVQSSRIIQCSSFHSLKQSLKPATTLSQNQSHKSLVQSVSQSINQTINQSTRSFQSSTDPNESLMTKASRTWTEWKPRIITYFYIGSALFVGVLILRGGLYFVNFFTSLDLADVGRWGFVAGLATGVGLVGTAMLTRRVLSLRPESVYQDALKQVLNDITVRSFLGNSIKTGSFRAYSFVPGSVRMPGTITAAEAEPVVDAVAAANPSWLDRLSKYWKPRRLQLFFQITGSDGNHAMCSAEVQKVRGSMQYNLLCVDILNTGQRVVLMGSPDYQIYQGVIKLR